MILQARVRFNLSPISTPMGSGWERWRRISMTTDGKMSLTTLATTNNQHIIVIMTLFFAKQTDERAMRRRRRRRRTRHTQGMRWNYNSAVSQGARVYSGLGDELVERQFISRTFLPSPDVSHSNARPGERANKSSLNRLIVGTGGSIHLSTARQ